MPCIWGKLPNEFGCCRARAEGHGFMLGRRSFVRVNHYPEHTTGMGTAINLSGPLFSQLVVTFPGYGPGGFFVSMLQTDEEAPESTTRPSTCSHYYPNVFGSQPQIEKPVHHFVWLWLFLTWVYGVQFWFPKSWNEKPVPYGGNKFK